MNMRIAVIVFGIVGGLLVEVFGTPGLAVATGLLVLALLLRSAALSATVAIASATALSFWVSGLLRCEPTLGRTCDLSTAGPVLLLSWAALVVISGIGLFLFLGRRASEGRGAPRA